MEGELLDWEMLHNSDCDSNSVNLVNSTELRNLEEIESDAEGMIRSDYFFVDNQSVHTKDAYVSEEGSIESDNLSWIDPKPETRYRRNNSGAFLSDSGSDRSGDRKLSDLKYSELAENEKAPVCLLGIGNSEAKSDELGKLWPDSSENGLISMKFEDVEKEVGIGFSVCMDKADEFENSGEFWSGDRKLSDLKVSEFVENEKAPVCFEGIVNSEAKSDELGKLWPDSGGDGLISIKFEDAEKEAGIGFSVCMEKVDEFENSGEFWSGDRKLSDLKDSEFAENEKAPVCFEGIVNSEAKSDELGKLWPGSGGDGLISIKFEDAEKEAGIGFSVCMEKVDEFENSSEVDNGNSSTLDSELGDGNTIGNEGTGIDEMKLNANQVNEGDKKNVAWWKVPLELLRYCVFRVSRPAWSFSVAAAVMGFVIWGRRLYKMKRKSSSLQLKVTMDDKKVSQFMTRAARLNEAFSVVRRVPIIRPSLPTAEVNPWPVMSLR